MDGTTEGHRNVEEKGWSNKGDTGFLNVGLLVDSEIDLSTVGRNGNTRVSINKLVDSR